MSALLLCASLAVPGVALVSCGFAVALVLAAAAVSASAAPHEPAPAASWLPGTLRPLAALACNLGALLVPTGGLLLLPLALRLTPAPAPSGLTSSAAFCVLSQLPLSSGFLLLAGAGAWCPDALPWLWATTGPGTLAMLLLWHRAMASPSPAWQASCLLRELFSPFSPWVDRLLQAALPPPPAAPHGAHGAARPRPRRGAGQRLLDDAEDVEVWWGGEAWTDDDQFGE